MSKIRALSLAFSLQNGPEMLGRCSFTGTDMLLQLCCPPLRPPSVELLQWQSCGLLACDALAHYPIRIKAHDIYPTGHGACSHLTYASAAPLLLTSSLHLLLEEERLRCAVVRGGGLLLRRGLVRVLTVIGVV